MKTKDRKKYIYAILLVSILFFVMLILDNPTILTKKKFSSVNMDGKIETTITSTQNSIQEEKTQEILQNEQEQNTEPRARPESRVRRYRPAQERVPALLGHLPVVHPGQLL